MIKFQLSQALTSYFESFWGIVERGASGLTSFRIVRFAIVLIDDSIKHSIPSSTGGHLKQEDHGFSKGLKIEHVVQGGGVLDVHEERHSKNSKNKHDKKEEETNVEQSWHGHCQGKE